MSAWERLVMGGTLAFAAAIMFVTAIHARTTGARCRVLRSDAAAQSLACNEIASMLSNAKPASLAPRSTDALVRSVRAAIARAGLSDSILQSQQGLLDEPLGKEAGRAACKRQSVAVTLSAISPESLGKFLRAWQDVERAWTITQIRLEHAGNESDRASLFSVKLTASSIYLDDEASSRPGQPLRP